jgi:protein SCO1/2
MSHGCTPHPTRALRAALGVALTVVVAGCRSRPDTPPVTATGATAESRQLSAAAPSLYELTFALTDANGRARHLSEFRGQPFVASMVYTHCTSVCPRITADLKTLDQALPADVRVRTRFVLFSLDPERGLDPARWTLLAAGPDDMRTLAAVLDVRFRPDAGGEIAHSAVIVVVDRDGVMRYRQAGLTGDPAPLVAAVRAVE